MHANAAENMFPRKKRKGKRKVTDRKESPDVFTAGKIGELAWRALIEEVITTPKPGLVDLYSNGAHTDMDVGTFRRSAEALRPFFVTMAQMGMEETGSAQTLFKKARKTGMDAEKAMYAATDGVNTHKGIIFTFGVFCAAAGRCLREKKELTPENLLRMQQEMTVDVLVKELEQLRKQAENSRAENPDSGAEASARIEKNPQSTHAEKSSQLTHGEKSPQLTHGEKNLQRYGTAGIRGEAIAGYPGIFEIGLPVLREGIARGEDWNRIKLHTLISLMAQTEDSNILSRGGMEELRKVQAEMAAFLKSGGAYRPEAEEELKAMDADYIRRNCSPGGCADLLAGVVFIHSLSELLK